MRRPVLPFASDSASRRLRDTARDLLDWFDAGTRTQDLPRLAPEALDLIELVKPDGTRYAITVTALNDFMGTL